jgi:hypothetical protein
MIAFVVGLFRMAAAVLLLPLAAKAALVGQWIACAFVLAVLAVVCSVADSD